MRCFSSLFW